MLMCSPGALFVVPGLLLVIAGLTAIPVAVLAGYGAFTDVFGPNFLITSAMLALTGFQLLIFGLLAKLYAHQIDPVFRDPMVEHFHARFSLDRGVVVGLLLMIAGLVTGLSTLIEWLTAGSVSSPGAWILALTLGTMGIETVFVSFLVGIFDLSRESGRAG